MKKLIIVDVFIRTKNPKEPYKKIFSRHIDNLDELTFPYAQVVNTLHLLFGFDSVVSFSIYNIESYER